MTTITKERIELFIKNPLENGLTRGEQMELARIALASLEAKPIGAFHIAEQQVDGTSDYLKDGEWPIDNGIIEVYAAPPVPVVPEEKPMPNPLSMYAVDAVAAIAEVRGWNACRAAMLQSQREGNPHVTPARLPGGFTIEDAQELHEDLVRSHISQALSGEKMKKKDRDADLRWIHGVIVQAAWFVKASLEQNTLTGNYPGTPDSWISCSDRMPNDAQWCVVNTEYGYYVQCWSEGQGWLGDDISIPKCDVINWMPLPEPPQEVK
ncbi:DUF551 domain-containing protein [Escherichia coli]|nr:DUF551 domain-containing protein [Salmonella enterica subsp. enterica]EFO1726698.1 DUF551 domain-containing protein [Escherichia coli]EHC6841103.1 DUF551 domain-containing protein [Salmonella enterica subsp. enterica]EID7304001.1 DUF551 domain-containing protein [Escherichia coli]EIL3305332.1 DUF551 domain-containing protein [Escherichia coli]